MSTSLTLLPTALYNPGEIVREVNLPDYVKDVKIVAEGETEKLQSKVERDGTKAIIIFTIAEKARLGAKLMGE